MTELTIRQDAVIKINEIPLSNDVATSFIKEMRSHAKEQALDGFKPSHVQISL